MKRFTALVIAGTFAFATSAFAADPPKTTAAPAATPAAAPAKTASTTPEKELTPQQQRMKDCNAKATGKTGDARKEFMSACLSGKDAPVAKMTQQEKMTACNKKAADMKGDDRKKFMSSCLSAG